MRNIITLRIIPFYLFLFIHKTLSIFWKIYIPQLSISYTLDQNLYKVIQMALKRINKELDDHEQNPK